MNAVRWLRVKKIRKDMLSPEVVRAEIKKIRANKNSKFRNSEFTITYEPRRTKRGRYDLFVMEEMDIPNAAMCSQCEEPFEPSDDYLCPSCRQSADS